MRLTPILVALTLLLPPLVHAGGEPSEKVVIYQGEGPFEFIKENLAAAIMERGLVISGTLHVSEMMQRTAKDLGFSEPVYVKAEALEFCSAMISHRMTRAHPANLTACPFTISIYIEAGKPEVVNVAFRRPQLLGDKPEVEQAVFEMLDELARAAIE